MKQKEKKALVRKQMKKIKKMKEQKNQDVYRQTIPIGQLVPTEQPQRPSIHTRQKHMILHIDSKDRQTKSTELMK